MEGRIRIWAMTDGRAGNESQALGLAEAVARLVPGTIEVKRTPMRPGFQLAPARLWAAIPPRRGGWPFIGLANRGAELAEPWPDLVIGAGRRSAPISAAMRAIARREGGRLVAVQIMEPRMDPAAFDLAIVPGHAAARGPNVIVTEGALNRISPERIASEGAHWAPRFAALPRPRVAVLIGGPSGSARFGTATGERLLAQLGRLGAAGAGLMITTSARTPTPFRERLAASFTEPATWIWDGTGENPYFAMLGLADAIVVSEDSVSMTSEAAATGKPVLVAPVERVRPHIARFHAHMRAAGYTRPFAGELESWSYPPLREAERVAPRVAALLAPAREARPA